MSLFNVTGNHFEGVKFQAFIQKGKTGEQES